MVADLVAESGGGWAVNHPVRQIRRAHQVHPELWAWDRLHLEKPAFMVLGELWGSKGHRAPLDILVQ